MSQRFFSLTRGCCLSVIIRFQFRSTGKDLEICTAPTIIYIELRVRIAMLLCIATEEAFLIAYAVGFRIRSVIS